jgi:hypothetical protein
MKPTYRASGSLADGLVDWNHHGLRIWLVSFHKTLTKARHWTKTKVKVNVKLSLCFNSAPRREGVLGSRGIAPRVLDPSALDGDEWSTHVPAALSPGKDTPGAHWIWGWVVDQTGYSGNGKWRSTSLEPKPTTGPKRSPIHSWLTPS